jgi:regulator of replication initiation timing
MTAAAPEAPKEDPVQKWLAETEKLRAQLRQLMDQESATQLEINQITNRIYTPVTSVPERDRAQNELGIAQVRLQALRDQITKARAELLAREQEGPPRKQ